MKYKNILAENIKIGANVVISESAIIRGINGNANYIEIGDNTYIGDNVQIICNDFKIGDYSKIQHDTNIHGYKPCSIGHNAWIGQFTIIDSIGGTTIGNNCGIGAHSQLWSHIKYGDRLEGCRFFQDKPLTVGNDVWFVGHCIVSPIVAEDKSMAMVGSVITKDMAYNSIYAGSPAKIISDKIGYQFILPSIDEKMDMMRKYLDLSGVDSSNIRIVETIDDIDLFDHITYFAVDSRQYTKKRNVSEIEFMKYLLPEKAKFTPI